MMISAVNRILLIFFSLLFSIKVWSVCSPYMGLASLNEVSKEHPFFDNVNDFIEVKKLDNQLSSTVISNWSLEICETVFIFFTSCSGPLSLSDANVKGKYWTLYGSPSSYIDWQGGFDIVLRDENSAVIDYLTVNNINPQFESCNYSYPITASGSNSTRRTYRTPDGVGDWDVPPGNSVPPSGGEDNTDAPPPPDDAPSLGFLTDVIVNQGESATITFQLNSAYTSDVTINYASVNGDGIAGVDYISVSGTLVIPAGQVTQSIEVNTVLTGSTMDKYFFITIESATNADVVDQVAHVTIIQSTLADHFSITHSGVGINCEPLDIIISAKDSSGNTLTNYTGSIQLSTSTNHGDWSVVLAQNNLSNGANDSGNAQYSFVSADNGEIILSLLDTHLETTNINVIDTYGITETSNGAQAIDDQDITFQASIFRFLYDDASGNEASIFANFTSHKPIKNVLNQDPILVRAITTDDTTGECVGLFSGNQNIELAMSCESPLTCDDSVPSQFVINGYVIPENPISFVNDFTDITLNFSSNSTARLDGVVYQDAGRVRLHARKALLGSTISGSSNLLEFYPAGFCLLVNDSNSECIGSNDAEYANCSIFKTAGDDFSVVIEAQGWQINNDLDFCDNNARLLSFTAPVDLAPRVSAPSLGSNGYLSTSSSILENGSNTLSMAWSEMGVLNVSLGGNTYLSSNLPINASQAIGRFIPAKFQLRKVLDGNLADASTGFSYTGQLTDTGEGAIQYSLAPQYEFSALNNFTVPDVLQNYIGDFFKDPQPSFSIASTIIGKDTINDIQVEASFFPHSFLYNTATDMYTARFNINDHYYYIREKNSEIQPFTDSLDLVITQFEDSDSVQGNTLLFNLNSGEIRYGRLRIENGYGAETQSITQVLSAEYFDGSHYQLNDLDNITESNISDLYDLVVTNIGNPSTPLLLSDISISGELYDTGPLSNGIWRFIWSPPLNNHFGEIQFRYSAPNWLRFNWDESSDGSEEDPHSSVIFGQYRGHDKIIYWKELFYE